MNSQQRAVSVHGALQKEECLFFWGDREHGGLCRGTCEVEKFGIPRRQAWGTGHCVRVAACDKAGEKVDQGLQVEGDPSLEKVLEEEWHPGAA